MTRSNDTCDRRGSSAPARPAPHARARALGATCTNVRALWPLSPGTRPRRRPGPRCRPVLQPRRPRCTHPRPGITSALSFLPGTSGPQTRRTLAPCSRSVWWSRRHAEPLASRRKAADAAANAPPSGAGFWGLRPSGKTTRGCTTRWERGAISVVREENTGGADEVVAGVVQGVLGGVFSGRSELATRGASCSATGG